ncbi:hypothetical protein [Luteimonas sp. 3794]|uniref:hypothetical protein n=1 Tax=Luteimonas sp. 3794 TaxID=2817730 RepID=UPI00285E0001|nr:hypothetical protein [Luteimonas sp. 3794]MDR6990451.1 hypothetical protein [Luteimonas sp. 3794]
MNSKADIDAGLERLAATLAELRRTLPQDEVLEAFGEAARPLTGQVPAELDAYVQGRVNTLLTDAGLIQEDPGGS